MSSETKRPGSRVVLAIVAGVAIFVAPFVWAVVMAQFFADERHCGHYTGCIGYFVQAWEVARWVLVGYPVACWLIMRLVRARRA
ncbi:MULTISPECIES: hypothetical protein [unclassified Nonomuraea]|uniref:hypothetical protein n=1 Tax=unclassified Nonomuraea TaxID=2593643 RepID=UPI0035C00ABB